jgi:5-aminolevulinate synthase
MIYDDVFANALTRLRDEQRYRIFIEIERTAGRCPYTRAVRERW